MKEYPLKTKEAMPLVSCMGTLPQKQEDKSFFSVIISKINYKLALGGFFLSLFKKLRNARTCYFLWFLFVPISVFFLENKSRLKNELNYRVYWSCLFTWHLPKVMWRWDTEPTYRYLLVGIGTCRYLSTCNVFGFLRDLLKIQSSRTLSRLKISRDGLVLARIWEIYKIAAHTLNRSFHSKIAAWRW